jgi:hypothetical protein
MFIKPYFQSETINNNELNELKAPLSTLELILKHIKSIEPIIPPIIKYS